MNDLLYIMHNGAKVTYEDMIAIDPNVDYYLNSDISKRSFVVTQGASGVLNGKNIALKAIDTDTQNQSLRIYDSQNILSNHYGINVSENINIIVK